MTTLWTILDKVISGPTNTPLLRLLVIGLTVSVVVMMVVALASKLVVPLLGVSLLQKVVRRIWPSGSPP
jgi:hypothetical protein